MNGSTNTLVSAPKPEAFEEKSMLPKSYNPLTGMIEFRTGPIPGHPDYALLKTGAVVRTGPRILSKKEHKRDRIAQAKFKLGQGFRFTCTCKAVTFHFPSKTKARVEGYEKWQDKETYECAVCHTHFDKEKIDAAVAAYAERMTKSKPQPIPTEPNPNDNNLKTD